MIAPTFKVFTCSIMFLSFLFAHFRLITLDNTHLHNNVKGVLLYNLVKIGEGTFHAEAQDKGGCHEQGIQYVYSLSCCGRSVHHDKTGMEEPVLRIETRNIA